MLGECAYVLGKAEKRLPTDHDAGGDFRRAFVLPLPDELVAECTLPLG